MEQSTAQIISLALLTISSIGAFLAAIASYNQARLVAKSNQTQVLLGFTERYTSRDMNDAIIALFDWRKKYGSTFAEVYAEKFRTGDSEATSVNGHRRHLSAYFRDVRRLYQAKILPREYASIAVSYRSYQAFREIAIPMSEALYGRPYAEAKHLIIYMCTQASGLHRFELGVRAHHLPPLSGWDISGIHAKALGAGFH